MCENLSESISTLIVSERQSNKTLATLYSLFIAFSFELLVLLDFNQLFHVSPDNTANIDEIILLISSG
jgi:hypothetical protein